MLIEIPFRKLHGYCINSASPGCSWVTNGEGKAYRSFDGLPVMIIDGDIYKWGDGYWENANDDKKYSQNVYMHHSDGMYTLCGPGIKGNKERLENEELIPLYEEGITAPRDFDGIKKYIEDHNIDGIIWKHEDGRIARVRAVDFGILKK